MPLDDAFERLLRKTEEEVRAARKAGHAPESQRSTDTAAAGPDASPDASRQGAIPAAGSKGDGRAPSPLLRAIGQAAAPPPPAASTHAPVARSPPAPAPRRAVSGPPSGNANLVDASEEFEVYERPLQPGEVPKSRGLRGARIEPPHAPAPLSRDLVPPDLPDDPPVPGADAPVVVGIPEQPAMMFAVAPIEPKPWIPERAGARLAPQPSGDDAQGEDEGDLAQAAATPRARAPPSAQASPPSRTHLSDAPAAQPSGPQDNPRIAIVQSDYNLAITDAMAALAHQHAQGLGATVVSHAHVPGVFDAPLTAKTLALRPDVDAVVVLGCVIQGETGHDLVITQACADQLSRLACDLGKPIGFGVLGPRMTLEQAEARIAMGRHAVESVILQWRALRVLA